MRATPVMFLLATSCIVGLLLVAGCDSETVDNTQETETDEEEKLLLESIDRKWQLRSLNGRPIPYTIFSGNDTLVILDGNIEFHSTLNYDRTTFSRTVCSGSGSSFCQNPFAPTTVTEGTYKLDHGVFRLTRSDGLLLTATLRDGVLSVVHEGGTLRFQYD